MYGFQAIVLICLAATQVSDCTETSALVSRSVHVEK